MRADSGSARLADAALIEHLGHCKVCSDRSANQLALTAGLREMAANQRGLSASQNVEAALLAALPRSGSTARRAWPVIAAAAALVFIAFQVANSGRVTNDKSDGSRKSVSTPLAIPASAVSIPVAPVPAVVTPHVVKAKAKLHRIHAASSRPASSSELAANTGTPFFPIPFSTPLAADDSGEVWRVKLPRAAMASFGVAVNPARAAEMVQADVIVGADGQPRAIRFIQ